jgi:hypothetical protein
MSDLFDGRLEKVGVYEHQNDESTSTNRCLTDGRNFLWVHCNEEGFASTFTRYGGNAPQRVLRAVSDEFEVDIVSEYEPQFWGFKTKEEEAAFWEKQNERDEDEFYKELIGFVRGETHKLRLGTIGYIKAEIAKKLIAENSNLMDESKRSDLMKAINTVYDKDHAVVVTLAEKDLDFIRMAATHEDDLPQA